MIRAPWLLLSAFALLVSASACKPREKKDIENDTGPKKADALAAVPESGGEVLIGYFGSMTGDKASFGSATKNGVELAINEINAAGGIKSKGGTKLKLAVEDDRGTPEETRTVVTKLINNDRVVALIGEVASTLSLAAAPEAQGAGVPMISPSSTNPQVTAVGPYVFRVCFIDPFQGKVMATFASKSLNAKKAAILTDVKSDYSQGLATFFKQDFTADGGSIVAETSYSAGDPDFKGQLSTIKGAAPDVVFIPGYYGDVAVIAKQAKELGITAALLGGDGWDSPKLVEIAGPAIEGAYFSNHYTIEDTDPKIQAFASTFRGKYTVDPDGLAALGYDAAKILADAMERSKSLKPSDVREALAETKNFPGVTGTITIDKERNATKSAVVLQVTGGKFAFKERINP
jgi:branched-chain amino acid transport system substrate-binding protein